MKELEAKHVYMVEEIASIDNKHNEAININGRNQEIMRGLKSKGKEATSETHKVSQQ